MSMIRQAVLAGTWYPADPVELAATADQFIAGADMKIRPAGRPLLAVIPHAGYVFSGQTAGKLFGLLRETPVRRIILLAPNHRIALDRIALSGAAAYATPWEPSKSTRRQLINLLRMIHLPPTIKPTLRNTPSKSSCL